MRARDWIEEQVAPTPLSSGGPVELDLTVTCVLCMEATTLRVPLAGYAQWRARQQVIQNALPALSPAERELLVSGTCGTCWDGLFGEPE